MGQIRKVGDTYYIEFYARGLLYSQVAGPDYNEAKKLLEQVESKIAGGEVLTVVRDVDFSVFMEQFLVYAQQEYGAVSTRRFSSLLNHFAGFLSRQFPQVRRLSQITPAVIESYKAMHSAQTKPVLLNFSILLLREVMEYGIKLGFINDNPTLHVRLVPWPPQPLRDSQRQRLARELFRRQTTIGKAARMLNIRDVAKVLYFANLIPLSREEMYR